LAASLNRSSTIAQPSTEASARCDGPALRVFSSPALFPNSIPGSKWWSVLSQFILYTGDNKSADFKMLSRSAEN
jgi:hypothetical protein